MNRFQRAIAGTLGAAIVAAGAALAGSHLQLQQPTVPAAVADPTGELLAAGLVEAAADGTLLVDADAVRSLLEQLVVDDRGTVLEYDRDLFGARWSDVDRNGCDTRNDILRRDLDDIELKPGTRGCVVAAGILHDPYTGSTIEFVRGQGTSTAVAIDHLVALAFAWHHGAAGWTPEQRLAFANDPVNLLAVDGSANLSKSSRGPGTWLPADTAYRCEFVARYTLVSAKYDLAIDSADKVSIEAVLRGCAG